RQGRQRRRGRPGAGGLPRRAGKRRQRELQCGRGAGVARVQERQPGRTKMPGRDRSHRTLRPQVTDRFEREAPLTAPRPIWDVEIVVDLAPELRGKLATDSIELVTKTLADAAPALILRA